LPKFNTPRTLSSSTWLLSRIAVACSILELPGSSCSMC
jgi:hypothetical protein